MKVKSSPPAELVELRQELHRYPELSNREEQTARRIETFLRRYNADEIWTGLGGFGLAALYRGQRPGPTVLLRADLDGLPIDEELTLDYASVHEGASHKCGHDGHMTMLAGLAPLLAQTPPARGQVLLLFQPAEETGEGAARVLQEEELGRLQPDYAFALHNLPGFPLGQVVLRRGVFASASSGLIVDLKGASSHAAEPHKGRSPTPAFGELINALSSLPQFSTALHEASKVTVIHARLGEVAFGTSPGRAQIMATLRSHEQGVMERLSQQAEALAQGIARAHGLEVSLGWTEEFPSTVNDDEPIRLLEEAVRSLELDLHWAGVPFPWSEDFGHFTQATKGALFGLGSGLDQPALHHPDYNFPDELIPTGVALFHNIIERLLSSP